MNSHPVDWAVATAGVSSSIWFTGLNENILVPIMSIVGIIYLALRIYYIIKNKGKDS